MKLTGERVVPKLMSGENGLLREHIKRYEFASRFVRDRVLDIACGVGYGTQILLESDSAGNIEHIIGVDIDPYTIDYAKAHYSNEKVSYLVKDATSSELVDELGRFDTIISFETLEHLEKDNDFINNLEELLKPSGTLIISTPFGRGRGIPCSNPYHVHQYKEKEFVQLLNRFRKIELYYQRNETIEKAVEGKKYYLMVAVCSN
ncbi:MAG: SAM-dependent methyltransferase [Clostridiales bacterium]|jgi:2-polyprenyl-3-methyl-5-hydroxy-6-metoxy-1,4-benzoquinol methylase|nr:SAM-dependent methyltransferase [Clostridiales bacterium]